MKKSYLLCLLISSLFLSAGNQIDMNGTLPVDPNFIVKTLPNGLTYYIRKNAKPENRAELRVLFNTGSITEDDDQRGLAHFIEHMAFNGTKNFKKQELVDYLESVGMRFGAHLNAATGFDTTTYQLHIPTDDPVVVKKAMTIMSDWASGLLLDGEEIEKERGVVIEEWRGRLGAQSRILNKQIPVMFKDSRYADRLPIGTLETLQNAPHEAFQRYYKDWYRPDLTAVIAVGDFDPAEIERLIVEAFQGIPAVENPRPRVLYPVPDHKGNLFSIETDPEQTNSRISIGYKHSEPKVKTIADYRVQLIENLNLRMLNDRLGELTREAEPPYLGAFTGMNSIARGSSTFSQIAVVKEGAFEEGVVALLREGRRAKEFGFTKTELERAKIEIMRALEVQFNERDKTSHRNYLGTCINHYLEGGPLMTIEQLLPLYQQLLPGIGLEEINRAAEGWITENRTFLVTAPEKQGLATPTEADLLSWLDKANKLEIKPYVDKVNDAPLLAKKPKPGSVTSEKKLDDLELVEWTLANGVRVVLKPTDFKNDEINFSAFSLGGSSLASKEDFRSAAIASGLVGASGIGEFDVDELSKKLAGKMLRVNATLGGLTEGFRGNATPEDLETALQLVYLHFTSAGISQKAFDATMAQFTNYVRNRAKQPEAVFRDALNDKLFEGHYRVQPWTMETLAETNKDTALRFFKDRFADASDFTFLFVGNFDPQKIKPLIETYLGGLPSTGRKETWKDNGVAYLKGIHKLEVRKGLEPKSQVQLIYTGDIEWSPETRYALISLNDALRIRLMRILREDMSGVYGVRSGGGVEREPHGRFRTAITFGCDPERVDDLIEAVYAELTKIRELGFDEETVKKVREAQLLSYDEGLKLNGFWLANLGFAYRNELDPSYITSYREKRVATLTNDLLKKAANSFYGGANRLQAVLYPEKPKDVNN